MLRNVILERHILVVEDDFDIRDTLTQILEEEGYLVVGAENGYAALGHLRNGHLPSLILLDLMMPVMNGWEFRAQQLQDPKLARIPVVIVSANTDSTAQIDKLAPAHTLAKPIRLDELLDVVRDQIG